MLKIGGRSALTSKDRYCYMIAYLLAGVALFVLWRFFGYEGAGRVLMLHAVLGLLWQWSRARTPGKERCRNRLLRTDRIAVGLAAFIALLVWYDFMLLAVAYMAFFLSVIHNADEEDDYMRQYYPREWAEEGEDRGT